MERKIRKKLIVMAIVAAAVLLSMILCVSTWIVSADAVKVNNTSAYDSREEVLRDGKKLNEDIAAEGFVLLKNNDAALPLSASERSVSLLGAETYQVNINGGGSSRVSRPGGGSFSWVRQSSSTIVDSLSENGFDINPRLSARYGRGAGANGDRNTYMEALDDGTGAVTFGGKGYNTTPDNFLAGADDNIARYGDAAIISLSRSGSEGSDNVSFGAPGHADESEHYLQLNDSERQILAYAKYHKEVVGDINKIIIIVNSPAVMELGDIEDDDAFDAMLWIGLPGWNGADVIADILTGEVNPSGRAVDFWMRDFRSDPTWYSFGNYSQAAYELYGKYRMEETEHGNNYGQTYDFGQWSTNYKAPTMDHDPEGDLENVTANAVTYSEGIFLGYRYYETVAADIGGAEGEAWYRENTLYPFGYGLSYTNFTQEIVDVRSDMSNPAGTVTVNVRVKNTGERAGKEVVQLYSTPEYSEGGIDKAAVNLVGFAKTGQIRPGRSEIVSVTVDVKDLASFDYNDANHNDNNGYELETGEYVLSIRKNSHEVLDSATLNADTLLTWDEDGDPSTPNNIYSQEDGAWEMFNTSASHWTLSGNDNDLHRNGLLNTDGTAPSDLKELAWMLTDENAFKDEAFNVLTLRGNNVPSKDFDDLLTVDEVETDYANLWVKTAADMEGLTQGAGTVTGGLYETILADMIGLDYDDEKWDGFLDQLTWTELTSLVSSGGYNTAAVPTIGKLQVTDADAPAQLNGQGWGWVCEAVVASSWNVDLAYRQGVIVGNETMWLPNAANGGIGWYGPAMNTHRNPLSGRNFEYYSQDGMQGGLIAAAVVKGAVDQGARVYLKHAFLNDQETSRVVSCSLVNEQALRLIYAKPFELSVRKGNANGIMTSFNSIGLVSSTNYATSVQLYSNEWGYKGINVTDYWMGPDTTGWYGYNMVRGLSIPLGRVSGSTGISGTWDAEQNVVVANETASYTQWYWTRETAKRLLYTHINSNGGRGGFTPAAMIGGTVTGTMYTELEEQSIVDTEALAKVFGAAGYTVEITSGDLPAGLSLDVRTGIVSGTPTEAASNARVTIRVRGSNGMAWIGGTGTATFNIATAQRPAPTPVDFGVNVADNEVEATVGAAFTDVVGVSFAGLVTSGENQNHWPEATSGSAENYNDGNGYIGAVTYTATGLPAGMAIDRATGAISGTPAAIGTFDATITGTVRHVTMWSWGDMTGYNTENLRYTASVIVIVSGGFNITVMNGSEVAFRVGVANGSSVTAQAIMDNAAFDSIAAPGVGMTPAGLSDSLGGAAVDADTSYSAATTLYVTWNYPSVTIIDGVWWVNGQNTGIQAAGSQGPAGNNGENGTDGENGVSIVSVEKVGTDGLTDTYRITLSNGETIDYTITNGADGQNGINGQDGKDGQNGKDGADAPVPEGGCNGSVGTMGTIVAVVAVFAVAGVIVFVRKRKDQADK